MATSGTYTFSPGLSELTITAFSRIGIRGPALLAEHLLQARMEANLALQDWANRGVNLWSVQQGSITTVAGTAAYTLPANVVSMLDTYVSVTTGSDTIDTIMMPLSRTDYASQPNKGQQGQPNTFWFNRQITPVVTLWPTPDTVYTVNYWYIRQLQDASLPNGTGVEIPNRFYDAFTAEMAARLAGHFQPALEDKRTQQALAAWQRAASEDTEEVPIYIQPALGGYFV